MAKKICFFSRGFFRFLCVKFEKGLPNGEARILDLPIQEIADRRLAALAGFLDFNLGHAKVDQVLNEYLEVHGNG